VPPGPTSLKRDNAASDLSFSVYRALSGGADYELRQLNIGPDNPSLPLIYANLATTKALFRDPASGLLKAEITPVAFGLLFNYDKATLKGLGTYTGLLMGHARGVGSNHVYEITGTVRFNIDYDTTDFTAEIHLRGTDDVTGQSVDFGILRWKADRPRRVLDHFIAHNVPDQSMQAQLAGPLGEELLGGFDAKLADPLMPSVTLKVTGAMVARKQ
jgi:hypothetical protein